MTIGPRQTSSCSAPAGTRRPSRPLLEDWLAGGAARRAPTPRSRCTAASTPTGCRSETLVLDATWTEDGEQRTGEYVARVAPAPEDLPVFPDYALQDQYDAMRIVGERTDVPVPTVGLDRADRRGARHAVLPDGPDRRRRAAGRAALQLRRQLAARRLAPRTSAGCRTTPSRRSPSLHAIPDAADDVRLPRPRDARRARPCSRATSPGRAPGTSARSPTSAARRSSSGRWPGSRPTCPTTDEARCCAGATPGSAT